MISLQSMKRPPSPLQPERESSWRDFREAASERRKRARRRRLDVAFLAVGCAAAELPAGAARTPRGWRVFMLTGSVVGDGNYEALNSLFAAAAGHTARDPARNV